MSSSRALLALFVALFAVSASAHVTVSPATAVKNSYAVSAVRVPHGCSGNSTISITVTIPNGVTSVKAGYMSGYKIATTMRTLDPPLKSESGGVVNSTIDTVTWSGFELPDSNFLDFMLQWKSPDVAAGTRLIWPVVQNCTMGSSTAWTEVPAAGQASAHPAPGVTLVDPPAATTTANLTATPAANGKNAAGSISPFDVLPVAVAAGLAVLAL
ncbi:hypothetical protein BC828DRAFT_408506 [Blastocladiella britannica]|nr:hypothetical protein BC828DRAFT_408506 [Blastocladiella britannica]